jgi:multiple sugar transport system substrate-binding protein
MKKRKFMARLCIAGAALTMLPSIIVATGSGAGASSNITLTMAYGETYVMITPQDAKSWWGGIAKQFEAAHPGVTVKTVPIPGAFNDIITKLSLDYREPSTAPTVAEIPTQIDGEFASSGFLLPLNKYLKSWSSWWGGFPAVIQNAGTFDGTTYAVNQGENDNGIYYNKVMFKKAGIPLPWDPTTWAQVISAAQKIKKAVPGVSPLFVIGGTAGGSNGVLLGVGNLLAGSTTPTIYDTKTKKWVVNSPGLNQVYSFLHTLTQDGLNAPTSTLFNPNAVNLPPTLIQEGKVAIALTGNYIGGSWVKQTCLPCFPDAPTDIGAVPLPDVNGSTGINAASTLGGWDLAIAKSTPYPKLAAELVNMMQSETNMVTADNYGGWVPPVKSYDAAPAYLNFAPPFQAVWGKILPVSQLTPTESNAPVWDYGFEEATGDLISNKSETVQQAAQVMQNYVTQQLGASQVETLKK